MQNRALMVGMVAATAAAEVGAQSVAAAPAARTAAFDFSLANMMRGPEVYGREPQRVQWSADSKWIYFNWNPPGTDWREPARPFRVRAAGGSAPERVPDAQLDSVGPLLETGETSRDRR